ncbi:MAG: LysM peptidoglycan-binding domain-containing protein [Phycisphaerae bacterium]|jgi:nucleoid-associated protein YgaU
MTTDAKIGLLLALVFIVAITFVINGLPDFLSKKDNTPDTAGYINHYNRADEPGIVDRTSRDAAAAMNKRVVSITVSPAVEANTQTGQNYQAILPAASEVVKSTSVNTPPQQTAVIETPAVPVVSDQSAGKISNTIYEVGDGDSLASIAQKFYGPQAGKKLVNVRKIYETNKKILKSMDDLQIGQKLVIPPLNEKEKALIQTGLFEKVEKEAAPAAASAPVKSSASRQYVIKDNDSLWQIAAKYLGNGSRYEEIVELNKSIDPDNLIVGTKITLPAK